MKICENCLYYSEGSKFCKCKIVTEEKFMEHMRESDVAIDSDGIISNTTCKFWEGEI